MSPNPTSQLADLGYLYSKALFSNWFFYHPYRLLIDCGEGCASYLDAEIFAIEKILLTHEHTDHTAGIPAFINLRNTTMGATNKDLDIYYPEGSQHIELLKNFISATQTRLKFVLTWIPIKVGTTLELDKTHYLKTFSVRHGFCPSLGYAIVEKRERLSPEFSHLTQEQIQLALRRGQIDKTRLRQSYEQMQIAHTGDAYSLDVDAIKGTESLIIDVTFLNGDDIDKASHYSLDQALKTANIVGVKHNLVMQHISTRYTGKEIHAAVQTVRTSLPPTVNGYLVPPGKVMRVQSSAKDWLFSPADL